MTARRINIAILSAGRRVELVQAFIEQAVELLPKARVFALDINPALSSACQIAHAFVQCPRATAPDYPAFLTTFFDSKNIGLVIPTIDTELQVLAEYSAQWAAHSTFVSISDEDVITKCRDKRVSGELFAQIGVRYPDLYGPEDIHFPAFAKPVSGSSSIGARLLRGEADATPELMADTGMMIMEYIGKPFLEYSVDAYFDRNGTFMAAVPRRRIETRAGEISKGITAKNGLYRKLAQLLPAWRGFRGCITLQVFYDEEKDDVVGLEINPRFGGGFPLSYGAGANYPGWLIQEYLCATPVRFFDRWEDNLLMLRYDAKVLVHDAKV